MIKKYLLLSLLFIFLSGAANGTMDTLVHHFDTSIFPDHKWFQGHYFDIDGKWYSYLGFTYMFEDAWHFFKGLMGLFAILSFYYYVKDIHNRFIKNFNLYSKLSCLALIIFWWIGKELFYSILLLQSTYSYLQ